MRSPTALLTMFAMAWSSALAAPPAAPVVATDQTLLIDPCSAPVAAGKATLIIGELHRTNGVYRGNYKLKVFPYFYKNDSGRLAIMVSDENLAEVNQGKTVAVIGTATTSASSGRTRHIEATAKPAGTNSGTLTLWFTAGERKMTFTSTYHLAEPGSKAASPTLKAKNPGPKRT